MASIEVTPIGSAEFQVEVTDEQGTSTHRVVVPAGYLGRLGLEDATMSDIVHASFRFLLTKEPKEDILREFELDAIERYFDDYPAEIQRRVSSGEPGQHAG